MPRKPRVVRELVGHIGVDAGLCWIGDPCYILDESNDKWKTLGKNWQEFCDLLGNEQTKSFGFREGSEGLGVCVSTGFGDGTYPVYVDFEDGRVKSVTVEFFEDEEDEED